MNEDEEFQKALKILEEKMSKDLLKAFFGTEEDIAKLSSPEYRLRVWQDMEQALRQYGISEGIVQRLKKQFEDRWTPSPYKTNMTRHKDGVNYEFRDECPQCKYSLHYTVYVRLRLCDALDEMRLKEEFDKIDLLLGEADTQEPEYYIPEGYYYFLVSHHRKKR